MSRFAERAAGPGLPWERQAKDLLLGLLRDETAAPRQGMTAVGEVCAPTETQVLRDENRSASAEGEVYANVGGYGADCTHQLSVQERTGCYRLKPPVPERKRNVSFNPERRSAEFSIKCSEVWKLAIFAKWLILVL